MEEYESIEGNEYTSAELLEKVDALIAHCEKTGDPPTSYALREIAGISEGELDEYRLPYVITEEEERCRGAAKRLDDYREYFFLRMAMKDPRLFQLSKYCLNRFCGATIGNETGDDSPTYDPPSAYNSAEETETPPTPPYHGGTDFYSM